MNNDGQSEDYNSHCSVVGLFGILIQISLGVLSFSVLIIKRHFENPKRPWKIWRFDSLKQAISQLLAHFINLTISLAMTEEDPESDTCLWYFVTNIFDNTMGVFLCVVSLRLIEKELMKKKNYSLISGYYYEIKEETKTDVEHEQHEGDDQVELSTQIIEINYKAWILQLVIWNSIVVVAKIILFAMEYFLRNFLDMIAKVSLGWIEAYPNLELIVVMVIVPVVMNGLAFWVQDNFLKKREIPAETPNIEIQLQEQSENQDNKEEKPNNEIIIVEKELVG